MSALKLQPPQPEPDLEFSLGRSLAVADLFADLQNLLPPKTVLRRDEPLAKRTTLRVGGPAEIYLEPACEEDLAVALDAARGRGVPWFVLGRGSNLLIRDGGIRGLVISLAHEAFSRIEFREDRVRAGAGVRLKTLSVEARRAGLAGFEFLEGIPGSLGGALRMNAGAMGAWTFQVVESVRYASVMGELLESPAAGLGAIYRACPLLKTHVAVSALLRGVPTDSAEIRTRMDAYSRKRWDSQPNQPSAGCTFKNPKPDLPAGKLIDELGLKGFRIGDAMISDVHANFFVNLGAATARDILALIEEARRRAHNERGVELETEVEIVGED